jgi:hypothetical protein
MTAGKNSVWRDILEQTRRNGDDLASIRTSLDRVETRLDGVERSLDGLSEGMRALAGEVKGLAETLPSVVRDVIRGVLQERTQMR